MSVSLHSATIRSYLQILASIDGLLDKAEAHCRENGLQDKALTEVRLAQDMWPFAKQVQQCAHHSAGAIEGVRAGVFRPHTDPVPTDFAALRAEIARATALLDAIEPEEMERLAGQNVRFEFGTRIMPFLGSDFLLSFSMPNFYFHASVAYAILRAQGLAIGKSNFIGQPVISA
ncbi:MAG: DUF1993 domain-containing protein [Novosphingobium sp.]